MSMWRCPHCGTPQPEAARCWVCRRSSTTCSTCRHFRRSLAASVGFCGLDRRRAPLAGTEHRGCWQEVGPGQAAAAASRAASIAASALSPADGETVDPAVARLRREPLRRPGIIEGFVPVEPADQAAAAASGAPPPAIIDAVDSWSGRETLFGDLEA